MDQTIRETFWKAFEKSPFCMIALEGSGQHSEPMTAQLDRDAHHAIWFYTSTRNRLAQGGPAMVQVISKGHDVFGCLSGRLSEETDRAVFDKHWSNQVEAWFSGGRNDPELIMLRFDIADAEVWTADLSVSGYFKLLTGKTIREDEAGHHAVGRV
jgi:general stress protein 26